MCGILFSITDSVQTKVDFSNIWEGLRPLIKDRGPSANDEKVITIGDVGRKELKFFSSVLSLRLPFTPQPIQDKSGDILQFNGELYGDEITDNDTAYLLSKLQTEGVIPTLQSIRGEYAFVYYDKESGKIWFARDCIGRRSLLYSHNKDGNLLVTSVPPGSTKQEDDLQLQEVEGGTAMCLDIEGGGLNCTRWSYEDSSLLIYPYGKLNRNATTTTTASKLEELLRSSVERRLLNIPSTNESIDSPRVSVLFSGGLDCTLLAFFIDELLPKGEKVDLLNVAFENKRVGGGYETPDRKLGLRSWKELDDQSPGRFRFVKINVPFEEMVEHREKVKELMWPKDSVMDLSIALAFYFASRGRGDDNYESPSKVLISGLGADELFGGYTRHTSRLRQSGYDILADELQLDFDRLHERNLGRDDRVCATWGKELRYPFLDEQVVKWAMEECDIRYKVQEGVMDMETKYILRLIAQRNGLNQVALEKKRAIQFGARSAKMEVGDGKIKGTDKLD